MRSLHCPHYFRVRKIPQNMLYDGGASFFFFLLFSTSQNALNAKKQTNKKNAVISTGFTQRAAYVCSNYKHK